MQRPPEQVCPVAHGAPHPPQWLASVMVFVHCVPQNIWPVGHEHEPIVQERPPLHTVPHAPQFMLSVWRSTHIGSQKS
jgi:hypothetical protein